MFTAGRRCNVCAPPPDEGSAAQVSLRRAVVERQARYAAVGERNQADAIDKLKQKFAELVQGLLSDAAAAAAAGRAAGTTTEPGLLWLGLRKEKTALGYLDAFIERLRLERGRFLRDLDGDDALDQHEWGRRKHAYAEQLRTGAQKSSG